MSYRRAKRPRSLGGQAEKQHTYVIYSPAEAYQRCLANPDIYKTPAGNVIFLQSRGKESRWLHPEEAVQEEFAAGIAEIDARFPAGMPEPETMEEYFRGVEQRTLFAVDKQGNPLCDADRALL